VGNLKVSFALYARQSTREVALGDQCVKPLFKLELIMLRNLNGRNGPEREALMNEQTTFSALVTGIPPGVHGPDLHQGESRLQFLIRYHPNEWKNFSEWVGEELGLLESERKWLFAQDPALMNCSQIVPHITRWANMRLPAHWRTLPCLACG